MTRGRRPYDRRRRFPSSERETFDFTCLGEARPTLRGSQASCCARGHARRGGLARTAAGHAPAVPEHGSPLRAGPRGPRRLRRPRVRARGTPKRTLPREPGRGRRGRAEAGFPAVGYLVRDGEASDPGTLIEPRRAPTAAHCVEGIGRVAFGWGPVDAHHTTPARAASSHPRYRRPEPSGGLGGAGLRHRAPRARLASADRRPWRWGPRRARARCSVLDTARRPTSAMPRARTGHEAPAGAQVRGGPRHRAEPD